MLIHIYLFCKTLEILKEVAQMDSIVGANEENMLKREKEKSILETSRTRDYMTWSRIPLEEF